MTSLFAIKGRVLSRTTICLRLAVALVALAAALAVVEAQPQEERRVVRSAEAGAAAAALHERARSLETLLVPATPTPDSDVVLSEVACAVSPDGRRGVRTRGRIDGAGGYFWVVDAGTNTYRTFRTSADVERDTARISQHLNRLGHQVPIERIRSALLRSADRTQSVSQRLRRRSPNNTITPYFEVDPDEPCFGNGEIKITTYDPLLLSLTETHLNSNFSQNSAFFNLSVTGSCNAFTTPFSTWLWDSCTLRGQNAYAFYDFSTDGAYHNDDFGSPTERTWVWQTVSVNYNDGFYSYSSYHYDEGELSLLIFGYADPIHFGSTCS